MEKKTSVVSGEEAVAVVKDDSSGRWAEMIPEILSMIFKRIPIPVDEMVRIVPFVCKGWMKVVAGPSCWREIDISEWCLRRIATACLRRTATHAVDKVVIKLVGLSDSTFQRLSAYRLGNPSFIFMAKCGRCLTILQIPRSNITDNVVLNNMKSLPNLKELDISGCSLLTVKGIEAFGNKCKSLVSLKRDMIPMQHERTGTEPFVIDKSDDSEAKAIANAMPNLQRLQLSYAPTPFGDVGLSAIIANCGKCLTILQIPWSNITDNVVLKNIKSLPNLKELDISGCSLLTVKGVEAFGNKCKSLVSLKRDMIPMQRERTGTEPFVINMTDDSEANAIANTMPNLQHLELSYAPTPFGDVGLSAIIANCGRCLTVLLIPRSNITDNVVLNYVKSLPNLKELDISGCSLLTVKGLGAFGNHCKSLVRLKRYKMPMLLKIRGMHNYVTHTTDDAEAKVIANTMLNLQHLKLSFGPFGDGLSEIIANCGRCLTVLHIPLSNITDNVVIKHCKSLPNLKELDISGCSRLTVKGLEAFGKECKSLVCLKRNTVPEMLRHTFEIYPPRTIDDSEAISIANTMPNLQHLELCFSPISNVGLSEIHTKCKSLSFLDIEGCWRLTTISGPPSVWETFIWATLIDSFRHSY